MKKPEFIASIIKHASGAFTRAEIEQVLTGVSGAVAAAIAAGDTVSLPGVTRIGVKDRPARKGRNLATGESIDIPAKRVVVAKPAGELAKVLDAA